MSLLAYRLSRRVAGPPCSLVVSLALAAAAFAPGVRAADEPVPAEIEHLLEAEPLPAAAVDPRRRYLVLVHERKLLPLERLAEPAIELAGRRVNPKTAARHAPLDYYGLTVVDLHANERRAVALPSDAVVGFPRWAPDGSKFAFTIRRRGATELWVGDPGTAHARPLIDDLNASRGAPCTWAPDSRNLLCTQLTASDAARAAFSDSSSVLGGFARQSSFGQPVMLSSELTSALLESQLVLVDSTSGPRHRIGEPAAIESVSAAPSGAVLLVTRILEPYPRVSGIDRVHRVTEVWDRFGNMIRRLPDDIRAVDWHATRPATLTWVERREGADRVLELAPPYLGDAAEALELEHSFAGLRWLGDTGAALVHDYDPSMQRTTMWRVDFDAPGGDAEQLTSHPAGSPRIPIMRPNRYGADALLVHENAFYLRGESPTVGGRRAFLERISIETGETERIWESTVRGYEALVDVLGPDAAHLLTRRESSAQPPNYFVAGGDGRRAWSVTDFEHPAPPLTDARRVRLMYERADGVGLGAVLHLPPGYTGDERLPLVVWAYPHRVAPASADVEPAALGDDRFPSFERAFRLFFLLRGYAVLDDVSMPIVGSVSEANDTFIEQVVANARAAIGAAEATSFVDPARVGVAGHSYGAFMVANLLAHSRLFGAGAALSGAYNRTLTPFGFQTERRTLWEAPDTYLAMSPILYSHRIEAPLLLVHGLLDDNAGTSPLQSTQFYEAIRGNGGDAGILLLPWEGHSYRARESVMETAGRMLDWFDRHLKARPSVELSGAELATGERQAGLSPATNR